jgi:thiamine biosynthesis lipoprotein
MKNRQSERVVVVNKGDDCWRGQFQAMASPCEVLCETDDKAEADRLASLAANEVWRIEDKFSRYIANNAISAINTANGERVAVDAETAQLLDFAQTLYDLSDGRFDITSGVLRRVWTFDGSDKLPSRKSVEKVLRSVGWQQAVWNSPHLQMQVGMEIDFGGFGKEYAVDRVSALLYDESTASCLVNLGGDLAVSRKANSDRGWRIGIQAFAAAEKIPATLLNVQVGALATSGDARRFLMRDGVRYSHILDPHTGWPVPGAPHSITVAADTCSQAGMLSTLALLEGQGAEAFLNAQEVDYWCSR